MQGKVNVILSVLVLVCFIPATLGFALIYHHCSGCQSHDKETAILLTAHTHEEDGCFCTESSTNDASHDCGDQHEGACHDENAPVKHTHDCVVELKKLEEPFTPVTFNNWLPIPLEIACAALFFYSDQIPPESFSVDSAHLLFDPPRMLTGYERLIMNEVFRL